MNQRENFFAMLHGEQPEFAPVMQDVFSTCLLGTNVADTPLMGGIDPFGVEWIHTKEGTIPNTHYFMFEEIGDWKNYVKIPDIDSLGLEQMAAMEMPNIDRSKIVQLQSFCGLYERMAALMGFENTLISLVEDPEGCHSFLEAFTDYKIKVIDRMIDLWQPDMVLFYDDIATAKSPFMSVNTWREIFLPHMKKLINAVQSRGVIFGMHTCGKCEEIVDEYVKLGIQYWESAQPMNDLAGVMKKYGNELIVCGGFDTAGPCSYIGGTLEDAMKETERCIREYASYENFILLPYFLNENGCSLAVGDPRTEPVLEAWRAASYHRR